MVQQHTEREAMRATMIDAVTAFAQHENLPVLCYLGTFDLGFNMPQRRRIRVPEPTSAFEGHDSATWIVEGPVVERSLGIDGSHMADTAHHGKRNG